VAVDKKLSNYNYHTRTEVGTQGAQINFFIKQKAKRVLK